MEKLDLDNSTKLNKTAKLMCSFGWRMALAGAETRLIMQKLYDIAAALHGQNPEITINRSMISVKVHDGCGLYAIQFMKIQNFGINMDSVTRLNFIASDVAAGKLTDIDEIYHKVRAVRPHHYNKNLLIIIEGFAAAAFAYCNGGDLKVCAAALLGGFILMFVRFKLIKAGFFEIFAFMSSAFCGCATTFLISKFLLGSSSEEMRLAVMATTLLLVPGFPYMNGFLDVFKGYIETGIVRLFYSMVLTAAASVGLLGALYLTGS